jgi:hypothetical protein
MPLYGEKIAHAPNQAHDRGGDEDTTRDVAATANET